MYRKHSKYLDECSFYPLQGPIGPQGEIGPQGLQGEIGPQGAIPGIASTDSLVPLTTGGSDPINQKYMNYSISHTPSILQTETFLNIRFIKILGTSVNEIWKIEIYIVGEDIDNIFPIIPSYEVISSGMTTLNSINKGSGNYMTFLSTITNSNPKFYIKFFNPFPTFKMASIVEAYKIVDGSI